MTDYENLTREELIEICKKTDNFNFCKNIGEQYQDIITEQLYKIGINLNGYASAKFQFSKGENMAGVEIKHDSKIRETGRIYIECSALAKNGIDFVSGGIMKRDKSWLYVVGDERQCFIFSKPQLQMLYRKLQQQPELWKEKYGVFQCFHSDSYVGKVTSKGFVIPIEILDRTGWCLKHLIYENEYK